MLHVRNELLSGNEFIQIAVHFVYNLLEVKQKQDQSMFPLSGCVAYSKTFFSLVLDERCSPSTLQKHTRNGYLGSR